MSSTTVGSARSNSRSYGSPSRLKDWPLRTHALVVWAVGIAGLWANWSAAGLAYVHFLDDGPVGDADRWLPKWFEAHRTPFWNDLTWWGSMLADTFVKVALILLVGGTLIAVYRRWHDGLMLAMAVAGEATVFLFSSLVVQRDRPPVKQLDPIPPSGSFPSGHMAAATAFYGALFVVVCLHTQRRAIRNAFLALAILAPVIVGTSRMQRGMHHPVDILGGALLGVCMVLVVRHALDVSCRDADRKARAGEIEVADNVRRLDLSRPAIEEVAS